MWDFQSIYSEYFRDVYLYVKTLSRDEHIAEDITSETFLKAMKGLDEFKGNCDIRTWLYQIAKNSYFSYLRKNNKVEYVEAMEEKETDFNIEKSITLKETSIEIHEILHSLEEPYKEVFTLRTFGELSFQQIGALFQKNQNWACVTYHRARKKIMDKWRSENED